MKLIYDLNKSEFDKFVINHKYGNYMQTTTYGKYLEGKNKKLHYLTLINGSEILATVILIEEFNKLSYKTYYCMRGPVINYENLNDLTALVTELKQFCKENGGLSIEIEPYIFEDNEKAIKNLESVGFIYTPLKKLMKETYIYETNKDIKVVASKLSEDFLKLMGKTNKYIKTDVADYKKYNDFYKLQKLKEVKINREFDYYDIKKIYETFHQIHRCDMLITEINLYQLCNYSNELIQKTEKQIELSKTEEERNKYINYLKIFKQKYLEYKGYNNVLKAKIATAGALVFKTRNKLWISYDSDENILKEFGSIYYLLIEIALRYSKEDTMYIDFNGSKEFLEDNDYINSLNTLYKHLGAKQKFIISNMVLVTNEIMLKIFQKTGFK